MGLTLFEKERTQGKAIIYFFFIVAFILCSKAANAQTYVFAQLQGAPVNTTGWNFAGEAAVANVKSTNYSEILLCSTQYNESGAVFYNQPINPLRCNKWVAEFDFRIFDGTGADGIAFCFLDVPPTGYATGGGLGIPGSANGLKVCFDPYPNCSPDTMPKIELRWGVGYNECWDQPTLSNNASGITSFVRSDTYNHAKIVYDSGNISVYVNNQLYLTGYQQFNFTGYMGFTASTGGSYDNHSIKNVIIYTNEPPSVAGADQQICSGSSAQLGTNPDTSYSYSWIPSTGLSANNIANPTVSLVNTTSSVVTQKYYVYTSLNSSSSCQSMDSVLVTVNPAPVITASAQSVCTGTPVTFTATTASSPANYLWYKNNVSTGITTATYTGVFQDKDQVTCSSSYLACATTSAPIQLSVTAYQKPLVSITTSANAAICPGTPVTFTAAPVNGGASPSYQWKVNGIDAGTSTNIYTTTMLNNNDVVTCQLTSNGFCIAPDTITSNGITTKVIATQQPQAAIAASANNICKGTAVTFSMKVTNGSAAAYQWQVNGVAVSADSTYTAATLSDQDNVTCNVTASTTCTTGTALSGSITMNVTAIVTPSVTIAASANGVCPNTPITFTATAVNGGTAPVYQWKLNGNDAGTNQNTYTNTKINNNDVVTCYLTSNATCVAPATATSNSITMQILPIVIANASIAASANNVCKGTPVTLSVAVANGSGVSYKWSVNNTEVSTDSTYTSSNFNNQDVVICYVTINTTCTTGQTVLASITMNITSLVTASVSISATNNGVCPGTPITFNATTTNAGSNIIYQWMVNNVNEGTSSSAFTSSELNNNDLVTCQITPQNVPCLVPSTATSNAVTVNLLPLPVVSLPATQTITAGDDITLSPVITGDVAQYTWSPTTNLTDAGVADPVASPIYNTVYTLTAVSPGGCPATASTNIKVLRKKIKVNNAFTPNGDGINDTWVIPDLANYPTCIVDIYNRYGTRVFHSVGYTQAWDGKYNGEPLSVGVYYYVINLGDGSQAVGGYVTLLR